MEELCTRRDMSHFEGVELTMEESRRRLEMMVVFSFN
jgi:hypothetical protein